MAILEKFWKTDDDVYKAIINIGDKQIVMVEEEYQSAVHITLPPTCDRCKGTGYISMYDKNIIKTCDKCSGTGVLND